MVYAARQYGADLQRSFAAAYALLERPKIVRRAVVLLLAIHTGLLAYSAYVHSPTLNEPGHLVAGLSYWKFGRFDVYNVNPPLVKMVAALPVMAVGYEEDWSGFYTGLGARPEFVMGEDFVAANGERSFFLFMIARWACIPFSWLGGIVCYLWARDLFGRPSGVIACAIWCFEPNILAHASLITSDATGTALGLAACYTFWRWLKQPTWSQAALNGVVLGLAELTKTTLILFYPLWPLMWLVYRWSDCHVMAIRDWFREAGMLAARMLIGLYVLNLGYGFEGSLKSLGEFQFVSNLFTGKGNESVDAGTISRNSPFETRNSLPNRFANSWLAAIPVPLPANYLLGIDLQQKDFEHYGRPSYLRGEWRDHGWWHYYLYAAAIKVPLGLWALGAFALIAALFTRPAGYSRQPIASSLPTAHSPPPTRSRDLFILLFPPLAIFAVVSSKTGFSEHFRYVLPCFPFVFVWISGVFRKMVNGGTTETLGCPCCIPRTTSRLAAALSWVFLLWFFASSLWIHPHSLSYFNESIGGPLHGPRHLLGSNVDWGQGLIRLEWALRSHPDWGPVAVAYYGPAPPSSFGTRALPINWYRTPSQLLGCSHVAISTSILAGERRLSDWFNGPEEEVVEFLTFFQNQPPVDCLDGSLLLFDCRAYLNGHGQGISAPKSQATIAFLQGNLASLRGPALAEAISPRDVMTVSGLLHVLMLAKSGPTGLAVPQTGEEALDILTKEQLGIAALGSSPFVQTPRGVRYRLRGDAVDGAHGPGEAHRDQCLATFADLDLPLNHPLYLRDRTYRISDLLRESIANFTYDQHEMAWTAIAYANYLPPANSWSNRFGEKTDFSQLVRFIIEHGYTSQSCGGLHVLQAVAAIVEADYRCGLLDPHTRLYARDFLRKAIANALHSQRSDGSWDLNWFNSSSRVRDDDIPLIDKVIATGHMLELLHKTREPIPPGTIVRATRWLLDVLTSSSYRAANITLCPLTHALKSIEMSCINAGSSYELADLLRANGFQSRKDK